MSASWDSDLSSIIEKTNNNLKLLRKIGDKPQVRAPDVSVTAGPPSLARANSASASVSSHGSARPRAYVGANDDTGSVSSRSSARPRAFVRGDDDTSSMGSHGSARPRAYVRGDDDTGSMGSHTSARPRAYVRGDDDTGSQGSHTSARPRVYVGDDGTGSVSSHTSARPRAFVRGDDDTGSVSSRTSARPRAFVRGDDDTGSVSSRTSARPRAFVRGDDDTSSMSSNPGVGRARLDSNHGSVASTSSRPHVGIAGGGGLTAAMLQQHRAAAGGAPVVAAAGLSMADLGRPHYDVEETRSMTGSMSSRLSRQLGASGRVPHARPLGASLGPPRIRVAEADIPSDVPSHVVEDLKKSLETQFAARHGTVDKKVTDLRTDFAGLSSQTASLSSQVSELRDALLVGGTVNSAAPANAGASVDPQVRATVQANTAAIARLEQHSAELLGHKVAVAQELSDVGARLKTVASTPQKLSALSDNVEALVASRAHQEALMAKTVGRLGLLQRQMGSLVDLKAVENLLSIRLTREFRELEDRLAANAARTAEQMEAKVARLEKQALSQRQDALAALRSEFTDELQRVQAAAPRRSELLPLQDAQSRLMQDVAQLTSALERQDKKLLDGKHATNALQEELAAARPQLAKARPLEERVEQLAAAAQATTARVDEQLALLAKKQRAAEDAAKVLQETLSKVEAEAQRAQRRNSSVKEQESDKLRQRLARAVAELETLSASKVEVERRFAHEEQQGQDKLKALRASVTEAEKQKETQRLELMRQLQEESKLMGVAQGKNALLETLLAREKAENEDKTEVARKAKKEAAAVREQIRSLETEKEKKIRQLSSELQAKQTQVGLLTKTLKRIETASAKMLDLSKREAKTVRRVKATKEHELFIAQLKLKEMERVAQALQNGDEMKKQAALTAASTEERNDLEKLLLTSQLEKDELKQELQDMTEEFHAAKESQKVTMEETVAKLSSDYDDKIGELKQQISDKEQAMRLLRDTLVEKSNLEALEDELSTLKDEKNDLLEQMQRAQIEHERVTLKTETNLRLEHATEFSEMKATMEARIAELEGAQTALEASKAAIAVLEKELEQQEARQQREVSALTLEIKEARSQIDACTAEILTLEETKTRLEGDVSQMEANLGGASAEKEEQLVALKKQMKAEGDKLRAELSDVSRSLEEKQTMLTQAKHTDETNRQKLVELAMAQEEMESRYVAQIDTLTLKLNQERESSRAREQDLEANVDKLNATVKTHKDEADKKLAATRSELTEQLVELTSTLKTSQHREQQLQSRLQRILEELVHAANTSANDEDEGSVISDATDDSAITRHLDAMYATHRRTAQELERLQAEYELMVKQATADSATAQELGNQVKEHETQIRELEAVVEQLREELKEQYHKSAVLSKGSDEFSDEMTTLREEKRQLQRQVEEDERDRKKREVSYQRRTDAKEREVGELRDENKTLAAAVTAIRGKMRAVENAKSHDLEEMHQQLKDLEERTAALEPDESNALQMETNFAANRQEIMSLTSEVQSLYQKLTACCGILEWTELRASVFDEEEKVARVRAENAREMAKVQSVEQDVLMNAEFLNALLVAHGSTGSDGSLVTDFRWMQQYAALAPELVEKLRKVEARLREAVLDLPNDGKTSVFADGVVKAVVKEDLGASSGSLDVANRSELEEKEEADDSAVMQPPSSQNSSVDGVAIALALERAKEDYFSETSDVAHDEEDSMDEVERQLLSRDAEQPDVEHDGEEHDKPVEASASSHVEGASFDDEEKEEEERDGDLNGDVSRDESGACDELEVAERMYRAEQETSYKEQLAAASFATSEEASEGDESISSEHLDFAEGDAKLEMVEERAKWSAQDSSGGEDEETEEVERLMLEQSLEHSGELRNPLVDSECDDEEVSDVEVKHSVFVEQEALAEESLSDDAVVSEHDDKEASARLDAPASVSHEMEAEDAEESEGSAQEHTPIGHDARADSSFDDAMLSEHSDEETNASMDLELVALHQATTSSDGEEDAISQVQDALAESSFDDSMLSERDDEASASLDVEPVAVQAYSGDAEEDDGSEERNQNLMEYSTLSDREDEASASLDVESVAVQAYSASAEVDDGPEEPKQDTLEERWLEYSTLSDREDEADASLDGGASAPRLAVSEKPYEHHDEEVENSFDSDLFSDPGDEASTSVDAEAPVPIRMEAEDAESSEEEETMAGNAPSSWTASMSRLGMGNRRLVLEEDDDMDEVERLLLEQSSSSMKQFDRAAVPLADDDDDDFGEASIQSHGTDAVDDDDVASSRELSDSTSPTRITSRTVRVTTTTTTTTTTRAHDDDVNDDYLDESFDLEESMADDDA
ncbi:hypothetical protein BBJ28_00008702 [Nothophytophthora sp. Chile5]|nr:hypothetical protein BBJ28_00008702 [Nothophytophthora sp. Chile5]